ncbi:MAG: 2-oxoacid:acceptor oxidoreductase subunit alpha [Candidatus Coatesbacteria bacterium]|nr:MAG: 2-oxoacid:acceptor oxidoreductase subunit alpha [Candidatus Coatesbacteria bacterium]
MSERELNILVGGEAGQGLATIGPLLAKCLVRSGYQVVVTQSYESRIRGGHNTFAVRAGVEEVAAPREAVDVLVALNEETATLHRGELTPRGVVVAEEAFAAGGENVVAVPYKELAAGRYRNVASLGVVTCLLGLPEDLVRQVVEGYFGKKGKAVEENRAALAAAYAWTKDLDPSLARPLAPVTDPPRRLTLNGNQAIALGAVSAGAKFCAFYPMTPSTSVPLTLIAHAEELGLVVEQAEDEIAAINMALGASYAGAPALVATSGGGFALMVEGVSLAGMTETPLVVVVAQRPGPATGLPTRTEQADLEFVLRAGHGEFPRALYAPGTVEECFHLTRRAFETTQRYQTPAFVLTDQFLADSFRAVEPFDAEGLEAVGAFAEPEAVAEPYERFAVTADGVSPRLLPGFSRHLVVADSDEHTEDGHLTEDLTARTRQVEKRRRKEEGLRREVIPPTYEGEPRPEILFVSWGSSRGAVAEAAAELASAGTATATLHFAQVWPLVPEQFLGHLEGAQRVIAVEGNASGQFARLLRAEAGVDVASRVSRYDGLPLTPEYVLRALES